MELQKIRNRVFYYHNKPETYRPMVDYLKMRD